MAAHRYGANRSFECVLADSVINDVGAASGSQAHDRLREILLGVQDHMSATSLPRLLSLRDIRRRADDCGAERRSPATQNRTTPPAAACTNTMSPRFTA